MMSKHIWKYCDHCDEWVVICGNCRNNTCNAGYGTLEDGSKCTECDSASLLWASEIQKPDVPIEKQVLLSLFSHYTRQLPFMWNIESERENIQEEFSNKHLGWMCHTAIENIIAWPDDKLNRWLGYIQGVMAMKGYVRVKEERDKTRELFHKVYAQRGITIPETLHSQYDHNRPPAC